LTGRARKARATRWCSATWPWWNRLGFYAETLSVTPDHLSRSCRAVLGQSALDLLNERRMLEARRLLAYTSQSVAEVAQQLGYDDPAYFSKFFQRSTGNAPSAYRALVAQGVRVR